MRCSQSSIEMPSMRGGFPPARAMASMRVRNRALIGKRQRAETAGTTAPCAAAAAKARASMVERCALRIREIQPVVEANLFARAHARIKIREIRAAAERDVLAIVHLAAVGQRVGSGAPAQMRAFFQQADAAGPLQPARRRRTAPPVRRRSPERFARTSFFHQPARRAARPAVSRY